MLFPSIVQLSILNHVEKTLQHIEKTLLMPTHNALHLSYFDPLLSVALISERLELLICSLEPFSRNSEFKVSRRLSDSDRPDSALSTLPLRCVPCPVSLLTAATAEVWTYRLRLVRTLVAPLMIVRSICAELLTHSCAATCIWTPDLWGKCYLWWSGSRVTVLLSDLFGLCNSLLMTII